ncbi:elongation factor TS-domain-containing protein [Scleroderma citrinum]
MIYGRPKTIFPGLLLLRSPYSTAPKASLQLVAQLRKLTDVPISKAREALAAANNDVEGALKWLEKDLVVSGAQKAAKVEGRTTREGLVSVCVLSNGAAVVDGRRGIRASMIELNCETDFVGRNELFRQLAADIAHTAAFITEQHGTTPGQFITPCSLDVLGDAPLLSQNKPHVQTSATVSSSIRDLIAKIGEKVSLKRAVTVVHGEETSTLGLRLATYLHGATGSPFQGRISSLAVLGLKSPNLVELMKTERFAQDLGKLERAVGRQIAGFDTRSIRSAHDDETALYNQPFMMLGGEGANGSVQAGLERWSREREIGSVDVVEFAKWTVGE